MGKKVFIVNVDRCSGCYNCLLACKDEHYNQDWMPYAKAQPNTGQFWMNVEDTVRGTVPKVMVSYVPRMCNHCENAPCIEAGKGAVYRREDGLVVIDPAKAEGMREIVDACPYGAVYWNEELSLPQKCTGCAHLLDDGWSQPRCAEACASGGLRFGDAEDFADEIASAEVLLPETGCAPRVYYLNLPKRFVAGEVYDPEEDEVVIGAKVTLAKDGEYVAETLSDDFGDFWFKQVEASEYTVFVEAEGYASRSFAADALAADCNVGSLPLYRPIAV